MRNRFIPLIAAFLLAVAGVVTVPVAGHRPSDQAQAATGIRFCLSSASQSSTYVYSRTYFGSTRSMYVRPGQCAMYPTGGQLTSWRMANGWSYTFKNGAGAWYTARCRTSPYCYPRISGVELGVRYYRG